MKISKILPIAFLAVLLVTGPLIYAATNWATTEEEGQVDQEEVQVDDETVENETEDSDEATEGDKSAELEDESEELAEEEQEENIEEIIEPTVSTDIDGEINKEVLKGENYFQNIRILLPEDVTNYEILSIENQMDKRVAIHSAKVLVRDKEAVSIEPIVNGQNVAVQLSGEELTQVAGQEVNVQIASQVSEDTQTGDSIVHKPVVVVNEATMIEINQASVTLVDPEVEEKLKQVESKEIEEDEKTEKPLVDETKEQEKKTKSEVSKEKEQSKDIDGEETTETKEEVKSKDGENKTKTTSKTVEPQAIIDNDINIIEFEVTPKYPTDVNGVWQSGYGYINFQLGIPNSAKGGDTFDIVLKGIDNLSDLPPTFPIVANDGTVIGKYEYKHKNKKHIVLKGTLNDNINNMIDVTIGTDADFVILGYTSLGPPSKDGELPITMTVGNDERQKLITLKTLQMGNFGARGDIYESDLAHIRLGTQISAAGRPVGTTIGEGLLKFESTQDYTIPKNPKVRCEWYEHVKQPNGLYTYEITERECTLVIDQTEEGYVSIQTPEIVHENDSIEVLTVYVEAMLTDTGKEKINLENGTTTVKTPASFHAPNTPKYENIHLPGTNAQLHRSSGSADGDIVAGSIAIKKVDAETKDKLAGALFEARDANGDFVGYLFTNSDGEAVLTGLPLGNYTIVELISPEGYKVLTDPLKVTVTRETVDIELEIENEPSPSEERGKLKVIKKDTDDESKQLSEAIFEIESKDGAYKNLFMTDENGEALLENIPFGDYVITEMKEPSGYQLIEDPIEVTIEGAEVVELDILNKKLDPPPTDDRGSLEIIKKDAKNNKKLLSGAVFELISEDGEYSRFLMSNEEGKAHLDNIPVGKYTLIERRAPEGYELLSKEYDLTIKKDETLEIEIENTPIDPEPPIEKEVEEGTKQIGDTVEFKVNTTVPTAKEGEKYETLTISDQLDERLDYVSSKVLVDGKADTSLKATEKDNKVTLILDEDQIKAVAGQEVTLVIETKINEQAKSGDTIDNEADLQFDNDPSITSNKVTVPVGPPPIEKEVEEGTKQIGDTVEFKVNTTVPTAKEGEKYETLTISDQLDLRLDYVSSKVLVDGETDTSLKATEKDNKVTLILDEDQIKALEDKEVTLVIETKINEQAKSGDTIDNEADLQFDNDPSITSNKVTVPIVPEPPIEKEVEEGTKQIGDTVEFKINTTVPTAKEGEKYETLTISDQLDLRLDYVSSKVLVDGETDTSLKATEENNKVTLTLDEDQIKALEDKEITLVIETKINEQAKSGDTIDNEADLQFDNDPSITSNKVTVPVGPPPIEKEVEGGKKKAYDEEYNYNIKVNIPKDVSKLKSLTVTDQLDSRLNYVSAKVKEDKGLKPTESKGFVELTLNEKALEKHAGQTLTLVITTTINETAIVGEDIDNDAELVFENKSGEKKKYKTPKVPVEPIKPEDPITKDVEGKQHLEVDRDQEFKYNIVTQIPANIQDYEKFIIKDTLENALEVVYARVLVDGKGYEGIKVTQEGNKVLAEVTDFKGLVGKDQIELVISAKIKLGADLSEYMDSKIPNIAYLEFTDDQNNEGKEASDEITVTPEDPNKPSKPSDPEKPGQPEQPGQPGQPGEPGNLGKPGEKMSSLQDRLPQTGEELFLYLMVLGVLSIGIGGFLLLRRKKNVE